MKSFILALGVAAATFAFSGTASADHPRSYGGYRGGNEQRVYRDHGTYRGQQSYLSGNAWRYQSRGVGYSQYAPYQSYVSPGYYNNGYSPYYGNSYGYQSGLTFGVNRPGFSFGINIRR